MNRLFFTADLCDHYFSLPDSGAQYALPGLVSFGGLSTYHGPVATITGGKDGAVRLSEALSRPGQGRILIADNAGYPNWAVLGDRLALLALENGWVGIVVYGYVRDVARLRSIPIGVHALGTVPARPPAFTASVQDVVVEFLNVQFRPESWLYADEDGLVLLPQACSDKAE